MDDREVGIGTVSDSDFSGIDLSRKIAEKIMGWKKISDEGWMDSVGLRYIRSGVLALQPQDFRPDRRLTDAFEVVQLLRTRGHHVCLDLYGDGRDTRCVMIAPDGRFAVARHRSPTLAITLAVTDLLVEPSDGK